MKDYPAIKLSVLFALGILLEKYFQAGFPVTLLIIVLAALFYARSKNTQSASTLFVLQALMILSVLAAANQVAQLNNHGYHFIPENVYSIKKIKLDAEVRKIELIKDDELNFTFNLIRVTEPDTIKGDGIKLICKVKDKKSKLRELYDKIEIGNVLTVEGKYIKGRDERNPGEFDYNNYLRGKGISGIVYVYDVSKLKIIDNRESLFSNFIFKVRKSIDDKIRSIYNNQTAALLRGILLADRGEISYDEKTDFINSGVIHILAVSGLHVGYILLIFAFIFGRFNIYLKSFLTISGLIIFLLVTGVPPSAFRATVMAIVIITALLLNRSTNLLNSVSIAGLIILIINPGELFNPGFQLSFSAVISIAVIYPLIRDKINEMRIHNRTITGLLLFMGVSFAAQIGTLPFTIYYFGKLSVVALFTNLLIIPAAGVIVGIGILSLVLSVLLPFFSVYFTIVNEMLVKIIYSVIHFTGENSFSFIRIHNFSLTDIIAFYFFLSAGLYFYQKFHRNYSKILLITLCVLCFGMFSRIDDVNLFPDNRLSVMMIDVGQGDSFLVKFPNGKTALIDAGEANYYFDNGERVVLPLLNYLGIDKIDYGFVSHIDLDHYGGYISLIHDNKIKEIYKPEIDSSLEKDLRFEKYILENKLKINHYHKEILKTGNTRIYILNTNENRNFSSNNNSGLIKIVYGKTELLFTGDLESRAEKYYNNYYGKFLNSDVLKVGHHGSSTSSSKEFLGSVSPEISLISAGILNKFHHPSGKTLEKLKEANSRIFRTDLSGAVLLQSDGRNIKQILWRDM